MPEEEQMLDLVGQFPAIDIESLKDSDTGNWIIPEELLGVPLTNLKKFYEEVVTATDSITVTQDTFTLMENAMKELAKINDIFKEYATSGSLKSYKSFITNRVREKCYTVNQELKEREGELKNPSGSFTFIPFSALKDKIYQQDVLLQDKLYQLEKYAPKADRNEMLIFIMHSLSFKKDKEEKITTILQHPYFADIPENIREKIKTFFDNISSNNVPSASFIRKNIQRILNNEEPEYPKPKKPILVPSKDFPPAPPKKTVPVAETPALETLSFTKLMEYLENNLEIMITQDTILRLYKLASNKNEVEKVKRFLQKNQERIVDANALNKSQGEWYNQALDRVQG